jgi:hypothetical protein
MKQLLFISLLMHNPMGSRFEKTPLPSIELKTVRLAPWTINLQRVIYYTDTCYALQFRDQHAMTNVAIKTMDIYNLEQLKYFEMGLVTLKKGSNGDIAEFRDYSVKRADKKKNETWYILSYDGAVTNFQEPQVNRMIFIIDNFIKGQN